MAGRIEEVGAGEAAEAAADEGWLSSVATEPDVYGQPSSQQAAGSSGAAAAPEAAELAVLERVHAGVHRQLAMQVEGVCKLVGDVEELVERANRSAAAVQVGDDAFLWASTGWDGVGLGLAFSGLGLGGVGWGGVGLAISGLGGLKGWGAPRQPGNKLCAHACQEHPLPGLPPTAKGRDACCEPGLAPARCASNSLAELGMLHELRAVHLPAS